MLAAIAVESIDISRGRMRVRWKTDVAHRYMTPACAAEILRRFPSLALHSCKNDTGPHFGDVISHTSVPHVLEHLIIDAQLRDARMPMDKTLVGWTRWIDEDCGIAETEVSFWDDLMAVRTLQDSVALLNELL